MYDILVAAHDGIRWLVLIAMLAAVLMAWRNLNTETWSGGAIKPFVWSSILFDIQVTLGIVVYLVGTNWDNNAFYALVHPLVMIAALAVWHVFIGRARKNAAAPSSYRLLLIGGLISLALVIAAIPWAA